MTLGGNLYVGFQNGVGSQGEASISGNLDSTLVEFTPAGSVVKQWDVTGKIDGMGADSATGQVIVTVNEDSNSSLYTVSGGTVTHYTYTSSPLPNKGGTDAIAAYNGKILISASAPGTAGKAPASAPAVFVVTLNAGAKTAAVAPFFADQRDGHRGKRPERRQEGHPRAHGPGLERGRPVEFAEVRRGLHAELPGR